jgi:uncharacterized protein (DUF1499 family)
MEQPMAAISRATTDAQPPKPLVAMVGFALGAIAALMLLVAPFGYRFGLLPLGVALQDMPRWATYVGTAGAVVGLLGLITAFRPHRGWAVAALIGAVLGAGVVAAPWAYRASLGEPPSINDITTDTENPPPFVALLALREAAHAIDSAVYGGATVAAQQKKAYPDIAPVRLAMPADRAFTLAMEQAHKAGWTIVASDPTQGRIEATDRTGWYGFTDDVVLRVEADGNGSRLDIRSHSRLGHGDRGKNAERIRAYLSAVRAAAASG